VTNQSPKMRFQQENGKKKFNPLFLG